MAIVGLRVPQAIVAFTEPMANANGFLSMFMLGLMVSFSINEDRLHKLINLMSGRIVFSLVMSVAAFKLLPFSSGIRYIIAVLLWAPMGSMGPVFTLWEHSDHGLAGLANTISIFFSIIAMTAITVAYGTIS